LPSVSNLIGQTDAKAFRAVPARSSKYDARRKKGILRVAKGAGNQSVSSVKYWEIIADNLSKEDWRVWK
jgi:hypothetical protein